MIQENFKDIPRENINANALFVIRMLQENGFEAYLVGGAVRDLLIGRKPKDFDVVTNATNSQIAGLFNNCELIGRRFPIALVYIEREMIEVSTYVNSAETQTIVANHIREKGEDRVPGTIEDDSRRRDFTINALYFDPVNRKFIDLEGGLNDLRAKKLRFIGDANEKCIEDPVRIIRGLRQACQLGLELDEAALKSFQNNCHLISNTSMSRLREEFFKILKSGACEKIFPVLIKYDIFKDEFPHLYAYLTDEFLNHSDQKLSLINVLRKIDSCYQEFGRMREPILYGALQLPKLYREYPNLLNEETWVFEDAFAFCDLFKELWLELSVKKWVKKKVIDITLMYRKLIIQKESKSSKPHFVMKEYFQDLYRYLRFVNDITGEYEELQKFWEIVRRQTHLAGELIEKYKAGEPIDESSLSSLHKAKKGHNRRFRNNKKRR